MKVSWLFGLAITLLLAISATNAARRLLFRPLSAEEVYRILKEAGREDAVPEGRIVTQGIAAVSGFALGIKSGLAVPLAIGLATSNATQELINNINNINYTALANSLPTIPPITMPTINYTALTSGLPSLPTINFTALTSSLPTFTLPTFNMTALQNMFQGGANNGGTVQYTTQEICFNSRSLNEINDGDDNEDYENDDEVDGDGNEDAGRQATAEAGTVTAVNEEPEAASTMTNENEPATSNENENNNSGTMTSVNDGDSSGTRSYSFTQTGGQGATNCVVIQKPTTG